MPFHGQERGAGPPPQKPLGDTKGAEGERNRVGDKGRETEGEKQREGHNWLETGEKTEGERQTPLGDPPPPGPFRAGFQTPPWKDSEDRGREWMLTHLRRCPHST